MDLTPAQAGLVGYMTRNPFYAPGAGEDQLTRQKRMRVRAKALEALADLLLQTRRGRGRKPSVQYPALTSRQLAERTRSECGFEIEHLAAQPTSSGVLRA